MVTDELVRIFKSLFKGRTDAYGLQTPSSGPLTVKEPLTDSLIRDHLAGTKRIGIFPIAKDNNVFFGCIDLDREDRGELGRIMVCLIENEFYPYPERSKEKGYHVWVFLDGPIQAGIVRRVLLHVLKKAGVNQVEVFPKQDALSSNNGLGNYIFLPLQGNSVQNGRTLFIDSNLRPYPNQWELLSGVHRTKAENIQILFEQIQTESPMKEDHRQKIETIPEGSFDLSNYLARYNISFKVKREKDRTFYLLNRCLFADSHTTKNSPGDSAIVQGADGKITYQCFHAHCQSRTWGEARQKISGDDPLTQFCKKSYIDKSGLYLLTPSTIQNLPESEPLFEGYPLQLRHLNLLVGAPGDLKTLTTYEYARAVLTGQPLFGKYPCLKKGPVLIIDEDNPGDVIRERFGRFGFTSDDLPIFLSHMTGFSIDNPSWFEKLKATVLEIKPVLIIVDCLSLVHKQKENQSDEVMRVMKLFRRIANLGPCIVFVHHLTKDKENPTARGSGGIIGAVENEIWNVRKGEAAILQFTKKTRGRPLEPIELIVEGFEDETDTAPIFIKYRGGEIEILLRHTIEVLKGETEPLARASGIEESDTIESRLKEKQVSFTEAKLKKALDLGIKTKVLTTGRATLVRTNGKPFRTTGYLLSSNVT